MSEPLLVVNDLHTYIGQQHILQGVTFEVPAGAVTTLLGRNGAGKTTTLRSILGLWRPARGSVRFAGQELVGLPTATIARLGIGYVPEHRAIFSRLTVEENLRVAERRKGELEKRKDFLFHLFPDLKRFYRWPAGQLSGGQQQMLAIARALVPENRLLLIDEPSEGLAPVIIEQLIQALQALSQETTVLLVEQNLHAARQLGDFYVILEHGRSVHHGPMAHLVQQPALMRRYLGVSL